jgi:hypothetical protein
MALACHHEVNIPMHGTAGLANMSWHPGTRMLGIIGSATSTPSDSDPKGVVVEFRRL